MLFISIGINARKAAKLWTRGIRTRSRLRALGDADVLWADLDETDLENLRQYFDTLPAAASPPIHVPLRKDHPVIAPTARGSRAVATAALLTPAGRAAALAEIDSLVDAPSAKNNSAQRWATWCELLEPFGERPLPMTADKVRMVAAGLRCGKFRSAQRYFSTASIEHLKAYGHRPGSLVTFAMTRYARAVSRGVGPVSCKESFQIEGLVDAMDVPDVDELAFLNDADCIWPCGAACLGAWWLVRSIEMTAAKVKHMTLDDKLLRVHWALPASKTDIQALGISRSHRCLCTSHPDLMKICPFHTAVQYLKLMKEFFKEKNDFADLPLFPNAKGGVLSHSASVRLIRAAATAGGDSLAFQQKKYGEHTLRVSGAQFLARALNVDVYVIQLYGRWASRAVARYVQEAPLTRPLPAAGLQQSAVTLDVIVKMVADLMLKDDGAKKDVAQAVLEVTNCKHEDQQLALCSEVQACLSPPAPVDDVSAEFRVINKATKVTHAILIGPAPGVDSSTYLARCGWSFGFAPHAFAAAGDVPRKLCQKCFRPLADMAEEASSAQSSSSKSSSD